MKLPILRSLVAATVATASLAHAASSSSSLDSLFAVTDVRMVEAATRLEALDLCQRDIPDGLSVGADWGIGPNGGLLHLCQVRTKLDTLQHASSVLQRLAVFAGATCPSDMKLLVSPRTGIVVCTVYASLSHEIAATGQYIEDLAVTKERNYNNDAPGWTTLPYSLHTTTVPPTPANRGVFLSTCTPVRAVTALQVLNNVTISDVATVCPTRLGVAWRAAGANGFLDQQGNATKTVLCTERLATKGPRSTNCDDTSTMQLVDVALVNATTKCTGDFQTTYPLTPTTTLCAKWETIANNGTYIADIDLHRVNAALGEDSNPTAVEYLPGRFQLVAKQNLNTASQPVYLFTRSTQTSTIATSPPLVKPPLTAHITASGDALSFKILQIADLHFTGDPNFACRDAPADVVNCTEKVMTKWVNDLLDVEKPDFVAFTGDNVETFSTSRQQLAMDAVVSGVEQRGIPYGMIFGNHDDENNFAREDIVRIAASKPHSYTQRGPIHVDGVGNYELGVQAPVDGPWGSKGSDVFRMYFLDSHGYPNKTTYPLVSASYDWVKPNQIEYYRQLSHAHAAEKNRVPAIMFFHIPLVEYAANAPNKTNGEQYETVASSDVSTNLFSTLVEMGEVKATFVGHDHVNDYCYQREGVQLCYGGGAGFGRAYGSPTFARRARAIEWTVNNKGERTIRSWKRRFGELSDTWLEETLYTETA